LEDFFSVIGASRILLSPCSLKNKSSFFITELFSFYPLSKVF
jgi:hypothetical protein